MRLACLATALSLAFVALALRLSPSAAQAPATAPAQHASAEQARRARVLATFTGGQVTVGQMEDAIANKSQITRATVASGDGRARFLDDIVRYELLVREAERRGFDKHQTVVEAMRATAIAGVQARPEGTPPSVSAEAVAAYFSEHRDRFKHGEKRRASYIELATAAEAQAAIKELRGADRQRFSQVARERSRDLRTRRQGGELGYFERNGQQTSGEATLPAPLVAAAFALARVGDISARPIAVGGGFGVLMLTAKCRRVDRPLPKVEGKIREQLAEQERMRQLDALVARLRTEIKPEVHPELLDAIALDPLAPLDIPHGFEAAPPDPLAPPRLVKPDGF